FPSQSHDLHIASESSPMHKTSHPFLFNTPAPAHLYTLSLHDALPISPQFGKPFGKLPFDKKPNPAQSSMRLGEIRTNRDGLLGRSEEHTSELQSRFDLVCRLLLEKKKKKNISRGQPSATISG